MICGRYDDHDYAKFGREKELEIIRNVIRHASTSYSRHLGTSRNSIIASSSASHGTGNAGDDNHSESGSSKSENGAKSENTRSENGTSPSGSVPMLVGPSAPSPLHITNGNSAMFAEGSQKMYRTSAPSFQESASTSMSPGVETSSNQCLSMFLRVLYIY
jgi:hypothetical protein